MSNYEDLRQNIYEIDNLIKRLEAARDSGMTHVQFFERNGFKICALGFTTLTEQIMIFE